MTARVKRLMHAALTAYVTVLATMTGPSPSEMLAAMTAIVMVNVKTRMRIA